MLENDNSNNVEEDTGGRLNVGTCRARLIGEDVRWIRADRIVVLWEWRILLDNEGRAGDSGEERDREESAKRTNMCASSACSISCRQYCPAGECSG